jgi:23S rRNA (uracil1939-C5)-methyltransferase
MALDAAEITSNDTVWDLYCGAGTITLAIAKRAKFVLGVEQNEGSIADAKKNSIKYEIDNVQFIAGDCRSIIGMEELPKPDIIITVHPALVCTPM